MKSRFTAEGALAGDKSLVTFTWRPVLTGDPCLRPSSQNLLLLLGAGDHRFATEVW
ncbi:MAG: hypothetical protein WAL04_09975 [Acidimicrobiales bacterium]